MKTIRFFCFSLIFLTFTICSFGQIPSYVPVGGLVGYWPLDNNANDLSASSNNGTVGSASSATDRFDSPNKAFSFMSVTDQISMQTTNFPTGNSPRSIALWFKSSTTVDGQYELFNYGENTSGGRFGLIINNVEIPSQGPKGIGLEAVNSTVMIPFTLDLNWHHLVVVYPNVTGKTEDARVYLDGVEGIKSSYLSLDINTTSCCGIIGKNNVTTGYSFSGKIDEVGIWDRVLTDCEIKSLYESSIPDCAEVSSINNDYTNENSLYIYPNPASGKVKIVSVENNFTYFLNDLLGRELANGVSDINNFELNLSDYKPGVYILNIVNSNKHQQIKIIKE